MTLILKFNQVVMAMLKTGLYQNVSIITSQFKMLRQNLFKKAIFGKAQGFKN